MDTLHDARMAYLTQLAAWCEREADTRRRTAEIKLKQGDASALFEQGMAQATENIAGMLRDGLAALEPGDK
jgi:hypothetical protein